MGGLEAGMGYDAFLSAEVLFPRAFSILPRLAVSIRNNLPIPWGEECYHQPTKGHRGMNLCSSYKGLWFRVRRAWCYTRCRAFPLVSGTLHRNGCLAYWWREEVNFGDLITPVLLKHYSYTPIFTRPSRARLAAAGSILEHLPNDFSGIILGSGFILETSAMPFPKATILALRGELTRRRVGARQKMVLGDPGLLADKAMPRREAKKYALGVVPHFSEQDAPIFGRLQEHLGTDMRFIGVQDDPLAVFAAIDECEHILSSSLHGLIVADSLGIPNRWLASDKLLGGRFKFDDYYTAIKICAEPAALRGDETLKELVALTSVKPSVAIEESKESLDGLWRRLRSCG